VQGDLGPQGPNPIDATNAMNRAAADAQRQGSLGTGAAPAAPPPPAGVTILTPQQAAAGGSLAGGGGGGAPAAATTGGSLGPALTPKAAPAGVTIPTPNAVAAAKAAAPAAGPGAPNPAAAGPGAPPPPAGTANQAGAGTGNLSDLTNSIMSQLQQVQSGLGSTGQSADVSAVYLRQSQSILDMLNQEETTLRADAQKNGTTVDPEIADVLVRGDRPSAALGDPGQLGPGQPRGQRPCGQRADLPRQRCGQQPVPAGQAAGTDAGQQDQRLEPLRRHGGR